MESRLQKVYKIVRLIQNTIGIHYPDFLCKSNDPCFTLSDLSLYRILTPDPVYHFFIFRSPVS